MYKPPLESDWKVYRSRTAAWRDRYLARKNAEILAILTDQARTPTAQFWDTKEEMAQVARQLQDCLDPHARSKMSIHLLTMVQYGMIDDADLAEFSEELRAWVVGVAKGLGG